MADSCILCNKRDADFDPYLCVSCANAIMGGGVTAQAGYRFIFAVLQSYLQSVTGDKQQRDSVPPNAQAYFVAPAVNFHNARRFHYFCRLAERVRHIPGDIVECGVEYGQSLFYWCSIAFDDPMLRNVWGFDSFIGPQRIYDKDVGRDGTVIQPKEGFYDVDILKGFMSALIFYGLPAVWLSSHLTLIKGFYSETLSLYTGKPIAILHLDTNFYDSYKTCLDILYPMVVDGGLVIFDEYGSSHDLVNSVGARRAIDEFAQATGEVIRQDKMYGKFFFMKGDIKRT